nr:hypothetical protein BaRGS_002464 [Batillaria attramentaria]
MSDILDLERNGVEENHGPIVSSVISTDVASCESKSSLQSSNLSLELKKMQITTKAKLCKDRLFSVALHPSSTKVLAMAGDKWGRLGFWDIESKDQETVTVYRPHSRPIGHIYVPPSDPHKVYTCSYDSTLRRGDFERGVFDELYSVPEEEDDLFRNFDFLSPSTLLLAQFRGDVSVIDVRSPSNKADQSYNVCDKYLRTVSSHPVNKNFFLTAGTNMQVSVWDIRKLKAKGNKPLHALTHGRAVSSAYFSPLTGSRILTCSSDDTLNIYNCSSGCSGVSRAKTINHNNHTGRWLTPFRAVWHPASEDVFFVGSMKTPRRIEVFGADGRLVHEFQGEVLSSVCSVIQFHPSRSILVGGNSSGYVFPFM